MGMSLQARIAALPELERRAWLAEQPEWLIEEMARGEWWWVARPEQVPPPGDWFVCLALAGRGFGKSRAGSEWIVEQVLKHPYDARGTPTEWLVIAETLSDARTICMEGPAGILRVLERRKIKHRYKMSPRPMVLFPSGSKIYTEGADDADVGRGYNASGAWLDEICIAEGELIATDQGDTPIEKIEVGSKVLTRSGFRAVSAMRMSSPDASVLRIMTEDGSVTLTPNHRVWVVGRGWLFAEDVRPDDSMLTCLPKMNLLPATLQPSMTGMANVGSTTSGWDITSIDPDRSFTAVSGSRPTDRSLMDTKSITSTVVAGTTDWRISNSSPLRRIEGSQPSNEMTELGKINRHQMPCESGSPLIGSAANLDQSYASNAERHSSALACEPRTVLTNVDESQPGAIRPTLVLAVEKVSAHARVYDLTVEGAPEFFAGGLLVHNCKWVKPKASWYEGIMPSLRADLIGDHPRAFVTTTPKPIELITEWVRRKDQTIHIIRGSTFDNASNLSAMVIRELKTRYEGTLIGRQELYGELIEAFEGALFSRLDLENYRRQEPPDDLTSTVVGMDPSLTGEDDEMGVVVVGRTRDNHMHVLADRSVMAVGRDAALHAWRVMAEFGADMLVYESNLGKRWMQQVLHDAYYELVGQGLFPAGSRPVMKGIDAKIGKRTRAEPVAMRSEQGRLHMIGRHELLEDQLVTFTGWGNQESPDRLDAMVHACRWLMDGERKAAKLSSPNDVLSSTLKQLWAETSNW